MLVGIARTRTIDQVINPILIPLPASRCSVVLSACLEILPSAAQGA
jgi:hypothetical protein